MEAFVCQWYPALYGFDDDKYKWNRLFGRLHSHVHLTILVRLLRRLLENSTIASVHAKVC
jgi:hypothetical protein